LPEYLVFDSKLTTHENLDRLTELGIRFYQVNSNYLKIPKPKPPIVPLLRVGLEVK